MESTIPFADLVSISKIGERIRTQNNLATEQPVFQLRRKAELGHECIVTEAFTKAGIDFYLKCNGHNVRGVKFTYVDSLHRNHEMIAVRNFLKSGEYDALCKLVDLARELPHHDDIPGILQEIDAARDMQKEALK